MRKIRGGEMGPWCKIKEVAIDAVAEAEAAP